MKTILPTLAFLVCTFGVFGQKPEKLKIAMLDKEAYIIELIEKNFNYATAISLHK